MKLCTKSVYFLTGYRLLQSSCFKPDSSSTTHYPLRRRPICTTITNTSVDHNTTVRVYSALLSLVHCNFVSHATQTIRRIALRVAECQRCILHFLCSLLCEQMMHRLRRLCLLLGQSVCTWPTDRAHQCFASDLEKRRYMTLTNAYVSSATSEERQKASKLMSCLYFAANVLAHWSSGSLKVIVCSALSSIDTSFELIVSATKCVPSYRTTIAWHATSFRLPYDDIINVSVQNWPLWR